MITLLFKPLGLALGTLSAAVAGKLSGTIWRKVPGQDTMPEAKDEHRGWDQIGAAAAVEGAVVGGTMAVVDRAAAKAFAKTAATRRGVAP